MKKALIFSGRFLAVFSLIFVFQQIASFLLPKADLLFFPAIAFATLAVMYMFDKNGKIDLGLTTNTCSNLHGAITGVILISLSFLLIQLSGAIQIVDYQLSATFISNLIYLFILFFIVSFQEELLFRGYLYSLADHLFSNPKISIFITSILFSLTHALNPNALSNPIPLLNIFLAGLLLGIFRQYSQGIWMPIGFHWTWNLLQGGLYGFHVSGISFQSLIQIQPSQNQWLSGGEFGAEGSIITTLVLLAAIGGYWLLSQRDNNQSVQNNHP